MASSDASSLEIPVRLAANTVFALAGIIYVDKEPARLAALWRDRLAPTAEIYSFYDSHQFPLGPHYLNWLSPREYKHYYGQEWPLRVQMNDQIAALHLLAEDLDTCGAVIAAGGRAVTIIEHEHNDLRTLWVPPDGTEGPAFHITAQRAEEWLAARNALTGEKLELSRK